MPGLDFAGTVEAPAKASAASQPATGSSAGARAPTPSSRSRRSQPIAQITDGVSLRAGGAPLHVGGVTAWLALFDSAHLEAGQRLLVQGGAGGVGSIAVQLGHWKGAYVIATASAANVDFVRSIGADEVIDYTTTNVEDAVHDVDVVLDTVGGEVTAHSWACSSRVASS